jgi:hypothetical protein
MSLFLDNCTGFVVGKLRLWASFCGLIRCGLWANVAFEGFLVFFFDGLGMGFCCGLFVCRSHMLLVFIAYLVGHFGVSSYLYYSLCTPKCYCRNDQYLMC